MTLTCLDDNLKLYHIFSHDVHNELDERAAWCCSALSHYGEKKDAGLFFAEFACSHCHLTWHLQPHPTGLRPTLRVVVVSELLLRSCEIELALR